MSSLDVKCRVPLPGRRFLEIKSRALIRLHMNKENQTLGPLYCHLCFSQMEEELPAGFEEVSCNVSEDQVGLRSQV